MSRDGEMLGVGLSGGSENGYLNMVKFFLTSFTTNSLLGKRPQNAEGQ